MTIKPFIDMIRRFRTRVAEMRAEYAHGSRITASTNRMTVNGKVVFEERDGTITVGTPAHKRECEALHREMNALHEEVDRMFAEVFK